MQKCNITLLHYGGSTENGVFSNALCIKKLQSMMTFCLISELKAVSEFDAILTE